MNTKQVVAFTKKLESALSTESFILIVFTNVTLAKVGLVVRPLHPFVHLSIVRPSATLLGSTEFRMSYCDHWMSVVCRQQLLQRTHSPKLLAGFWPNLVGLVLIWPSLKIVRMVPSIAYLGHTG